MSGHQYIPQQYTNSAENVIRWSDTIARIARKTEANLTGNIHLIYNEICSSEYIRSSIDQSRICDNFKFKSNAVPATKAFWWRCACFISYSTNKCASFIRYLRPERQQFLLNWAKRQYSRFSATSFYSDTRLNTK